VKAALQCVCEAVTLNNSPIVFSQQLLRIWRLVWIACPSGFGSHQFIKVGPGWGAGPAPTKPYAAMAMPV
jgi:hypothetical protein